MSGGRLKCRLSGTSGGRVELLDPIRAFPEMVPVVHAIERSQLKDALVTRHGVVIAVVLEQPPIRWAETLDIHPMRLRRWWRGCQSFQQERLLRSRATRR